MKTQKFGILTIALALVVAISTSSANAGVTYVGDTDLVNDGISLHDLLYNDGSIIVDTLLGGTVEFKNWDGFNSIAFGGASLVDPTKVIVTGIEGDKVGVHYQSSEFKALAGQDQDTEWKYDVDFSSGGSTAMDLEINGFSASGDGVLLILENAKSGTIDVADTFVVDSPNQTQSFNWAMFDEPRDWFTIEKDVSLDGGTGESLASFSGMDQTFNVIPEPATIGLLGLGALGLIRRRRMA